MLYLAIYSDTECTGHCMPGFEGRQFDFLGLYGNEECRHSFIPARRVCIKYLLSYCSHILFFDKIRVIFILGFIMNYI
jgi:hypothetical protein